MKKKCLILLVMLFLTGCSNIEYNLTFHNDKIIEEIVLEYDNTDENLEKLNQAANTKELAYYSTDSKKSYYYDTAITKSSDQKKIYIKYKYIYDANTYINSSAVNQCFYKKDLISNNEKIVITTDEINCLEDEYGPIIDNLTVNIKVDHDLIDSNADEINDNTYTWYFTNSNYKDKNIYLELKKIANSSSKNDGLFPLYITIGFVIIILLVTYIVIYIKKKRSNKV